MYACARWYGKYKYACEKVAVSTTCGFCDFDQHNTFMRALRGQNEHQVDSAVALVGNDLLLSGISAGVSGRAVCREPLLAHANAESSFSR